MESIWAHQITRVSVMTHSKSSAKQANTEENLSSIGQLYITKCNSSCLQTRPMYFFVDMSKHLFSLLVTVLKTFCHFQLSLNVCKRRSRRILLSADCTTIKKLFDQGSQNANSPVSHSLLACVQFVTHDLTDQSVVVQFVTTETEHQTLDSHVNLLVCSTNQRLYTNIFIIFIICYTFLTKISCHRMCHQDILMRERALPGAT